jgi:hypothetical protein
MEMWRLHEEHFWSGRSEFPKLVTCFGLPAVREWYQKNKSKVKSGWKHFSFWGFLQLPPYVARTPGTNNQDDEQGYLKRQP